MYTAQSLVATSDISRVLWATTLLWAPLILSVGDLLEDLRSISKEGPGNGYSLLLASRVLSPDPCSIPFCPGIPVQGYQSTVLQYEEYH